jgi:hypothetical protein
MLQRRLQQQLWQLWWQQAGSSHRSKETLDSTEPCKQQAHHRDMQLYDQRTGAAAAKVAAA